MEKYDIDIKTEDVNRIIRHNYISTLILESESEINIHYLQELTNEELCEQILLLKEIKRFCQE